MRLGWAGRALLCFACLTFGAFPASAEPARFVSVVEDLPLMGPLTEVSADPFETPQGRIVRIEAEGRARPAEIERFYNETLPALGWRAAGPEDGEAIAFERGGERLALRVEPEPGGEVRATFIITPANSRAGD
ncbi:MAG: hypothetical protein PVI23_15890 [Maricaulaceae bacterium]|jgi:hypothetical protein